MKKFLLFDFTPSSDGMSTLYTKFINNLALHAFDTDNAQNASNPSHESNIISDKNLSKITNPSTQFFVVSNPQNKITIDEKMKNYIQDFSTSAGNFNYINQILAALEAAKANNPEEEITIMPDSHGMIIGGKHYFTYSDPHNLEKNASNILCLISTEDFFMQLTKTFPNNKLNIILTSCFSGMVQKYIDVLPQGSKLYTFANEESSQATAPVRYAIENYPSNKEFDIQEYIDLMLSSRKYMHHYSDSEESQLNILLPEWIAIGISGEGTSIYKFNPYSNLQDFARAIVPKLKEFNDNNVNTPDKAAYLLKWLKTFMVDLVDYKNFIDLGIEHKYLNNCLVSDSSLITKIAMLIDKKIPFNPSTSKFITDIGTKKVSLSSKYASVFHDDEVRPLILNGEFKKFHLFDLLSNSIMEAFTNHTKKAMVSEEDIKDINYLANLLLGSNPGTSSPIETKDFNLALTFAKDHTDQRYLALGMSYKNSAQDITETFYINITDTEMLDLISDKPISLFKFLVQKAEQHFENMIMCFKALFEKAKDHTIKIAAYELAIIEKINEMFAHKSEIMNIIEEDKKTKLLCIQFEDCLKQVKSSNVLGSLEITNEQELLIKYSEYVKINNFDNSSTRLCKFSGYTSQYNSTEQEFIEITPTGECKIIDTDSI